MIILRIGVILSGLSAGLGVGEPARAAPLGTEWTYQGQLKTGGSPADGFYDMRFRLYDAVAVGNQVGPMLTFNGLGGNPPPVAVIEGLFTVELDFGAVFDGTALWLEIDVRPTLVGAYNTLSPRQPLTAAPSALYALSGGDGCCWELNGSDIYYDVGNVGIGTDTPQAALHVNGAVHSRGSANLGLHAYNPNNDGASVHLSWLNDVARLRVGGSGAAGQNGLDIQTQGDVSLMRLLHNGNVGIDTTSPAVRLQVSGGTDASLGGGGYVQAGSLTAENIVFDNNEIMARNNGAPSTLTLNNEGGNVHLIPTGTGSVGIGTNAPAARLDVESDLPNEVISRFVKTTPSNTDGLYVETDGAPALGGTIHAVNTGVGAAVWAQNDTGGVTSALVAQRPIGSSGNIAEFRVGPTAVAHFSTQDGELHFPGGGSIWLYGGGFLRFGDGTTQASAANILSASVVVDPPSLNAGANTTITATVTGAAVGDAAVANPGASFTASYAISFVRVSAANTVSIGLINPSAVTVNPGSSTWEFRIIR